MKSDDITPRELELVDAIMKELLEGGTIYWVKSSDPKEEVWNRAKNQAYTEGYSDALHTVVNVLNGRGFGVELLEESKEEEHVEDL